MTKTICLDFNGVLDTYTGWKPGGTGIDYPPRDGVMEFLQALHQRGYDIIIHSTISSYSIREWLHKYGMEDLVDRVTNIKPPAIAYVDDRAIRFDGDYGKVLEQLEGFRPYWQASNE